VNVGEAAKQLGIEKGHAIHPITQPLNSPFHSRCSA
jgi:hypothetical protein